ncbi:MAG TPA: hypothetical protein VKG89_06330 [Solirubrobacterales bacterium]|nr:hypothetical protein [Solirubrobacterales bacterium]
MRPHRSPAAVRGHVRNPVGQAVFRDSMTGTTQSTTGRRRRGRHQIAFAALCAALVTVAAVSMAGATTAKLLGRTKHTPPPACPNKSNPNDCRVVGRVTGFPLMADGDKRPLNVHKNGHIVAWAIDVSKPTKDESNSLGTLFQNDRFGKKPTARIAIIKKKTGRDYKLVRQGPTVNLKSALGQKEIFTLDQPLKVRKGQIVAISYPTWAPNFAFAGLNTGANQWRSSRVRGNCSPKNNSGRAIKRWVHTSKAQQKAGSTRTYGCDYTGARLLYWAYFVAG